MALATCIQPLQPVRPEHGSVVSQVPVLGHWMVENLLDVPDL